MSEFYDGERIPDELYEEIRKHLKEATPNFKCPGCGNDQFHLQPVFVGIPVLNVHRDSIIGSFSAIYASCSQCGMNQSFAVPKGILAKIPPRARPSSVGKGASDG